MFELDAAVREWRKMAGTYSLSTRELDELEDHLRASYRAHCERGETPSRSFATALRSLGAVGEVSAEFNKVRNLGWIRILRLGWAAFAVAFVVPVVDGGITLRELNLGEGLLPGFQAIHAAIQEGGWCMLSAVTNVLLLTTMWRVRDLGRLPITLLATAASGAFLLNGWWLTELNALADLRIGYYLWWTSFGLVSSALLIRARALSRSPEHVSIA